MAAAGSTEKRYESRRVKIKTVPFEPDDSPTIKRKSVGTGPTAPVEHRECLYLRGDFLAVRNDQGLYCVCNCAF